MRYELVIEGNVFVKEALIKCCIGIDEGTIRAVKKVLKGERHLDLGDKLVLPGIIDPHVHFRDPGFPQKEDFTTGSLSAALGGVTTVLDMPNTSPPVTNAGRLRDKFETIKGRSFVDYGLFLGLGARTDVTKAASMASGLKIFLGATTGDMMIADDKVLRKGLVRASECDLTVTVHCEDMGYPSRAGIPDTPAKDPLDHNRHRPEAMESSAVKRLASHDGTHDARVHIAHVSSLGTLEVLPKGATTEVTPHHMLLSARPGLKAKGKMYPPLREEPTTTELRVAFHQGKIDIVASDHAPHTLEEKEQDFADAPAGVPGVETMAPLLLMSLRSQEIPVKRFVEATSHRVAEIYQTKGKGRIAPGMDADIVTVDMREVRKIRHQDLHSKAGWTPFEGHAAIFPKNVFLRGQQLVQDWEMVGDAGSGRPLRPGVPGRNE